MLRMFMRADLAERIGRLFKSGITPTAQQLEEMRQSREAARAAARAARGGGATTAAAEPENYTVVGNVAQIDVCGVLAEEPDFWAWLLGVDQTTYGDIRDAFALAAANPAVSKVVLSVDSPGGYVDGLFETLAAVESFGKPITVEAGQACSAAYALAAMAGPITPRGPASVFGSVGVAVTYYVDPEQIDITSTHAPNKRPDVTTEAGKAVVRAELDALHELFVEAIVRGRKNATGKPYTVAQVNADFGRGGCLLADEARAAGMIDKAAKVAKRGTQAAAEEPTEAPAPEPEASAPPVAPPPATAPTAAQQPPAPSAPQPKDASAASGGAAGTGKRKMTKEELKAQHPELFAAVQADGVTAERKRCCAHLKMAKSTGATDVAYKAIESGASTLDEDVHADYMSAAINRGHQATRGTETAGAAAIVAGATPPTTGATGDGEGPDLGDEVAARVAKQLGHKPKTLTAPAAAS